MVRLRAASLNVVLIEDRQVVVGAAVNELTNVCCVLRAHAISK